MNTPILDRDVQSQSNDASEHKFSGERVRSVRPQLKDVTEKGQECSEHFCLLQILIVCLCGNIGGGAMYVY